MRVLKYSPLAKMLLVALFSAQPVTGALAAGEKIISETFTNNSTADYLISNSGAGNNRERIAYSDDTGFGWGAYNAETAGSGASIAMRNSANDIRIKDTTRNLNNANRSSTYLYTIFSANAAGGDIAPTELIDLSGANAEIIFETTTAAPDQQIRFLLRDRNNEWYLSDDAVSVSRNATKNYNISTFSWKKIAETIATDMNELDGGGESLITTNSSSNPDFSEVSGGGFFIQQGFSVLTDELRVSSVAWRGSDITTTPSVVNITLEAENYTTLNDAAPGIDSFSLNTRADASGGNYMQSVGRWGESYLEYEFEVPVEDVYQIAVRGTGVSGSTNSFRVSVDGGADSVVQLNKDDSWGWATIEDANSGLGPYSLSAGQHVLRLKKRERNAKIDQLRITSSTATPLPGTSLSPGSLNFAEQAVGSVSNSQSVTLSNTGAAPLNITSITTTGDFSKSNNCNNLVAAGSSCQIDVSFSPSTEGGLAGTLAVLSDDADSPVQVQLSGVSFVTGCGANTVGKEGHYFSENFECSDWKKNFRIWSRDDGKVLREKGEAARSGDYGIRMTVPKGQWGGGVIFFDHSRHGQVGNFTEIWSRYYIKFGPKWYRDDYRTGKAGYRARSSEVCRAPCLEMTDTNHTTNTGEPTTTKGGGPDSKIYGTAYYHKNISQKDEDNRTFSHNGGGAKWTSGLREREKWYCVEVHHVLNTPGKNNGVYQNWLDGVLVGDVNNVPQRADEKYNIDASSLVTFISPWGSDRDMNVYYDDWAVSDKRIGCQ